jgi:hypothetical protein
MRIPTEFTTAVCFLCAENHKKEKLYGGTAFLVSLDEPDCPDIRWDYLVTAKHCVEKAFADHANLFCRINLKSGGVRFIALPPPHNWELSEDSDVAVIAFQYEDEMEMTGFDSESFLTDEVAQREYIGIGDDVFIMGLFKEAYGVEKNFPVVRSGMIASRLDKLQDPNTGLDYPAMLIEVRSIGGLSGSPVLMALRNSVGIAPAPRGYHPLTHSLILVGLIRGHWDLMVKEVLVDFGTNEMEKLNLGMAIVTPIREVQKVLMNEELKRRRRADIRKYRKEHTPTQD